MLGGFVSVAPLPARTEWFGDARDAGRALRVSWHHELGCVVLSMWRGDSCVATTRLTSTEAAHLVGALAAGLSAAVPPVERAADTGRRDLESA